MKNSYDEYEDSLNCPRQDRIDGLQAIVDTYTQPPRALNLQQLLYITETRIKIEGLQRSLATSQGMEYEEYITERSYRAGV